MSAAAVSSNVMIEVAVATTVVRSVIIATGMGTDMETNMKIGAGTAMSNPFTFHHPYIMNQHGDHPASISFSPWIFAGR